MTKIAIVLFSAGEPAYPGDIEEYLQNIYNDPFLFPVPFMRGIISAFTAKSKSKKVRAIVEENKAAGRFNNPFDTIKDKFKRELKKRSIEADIFHAERFGRYNIEKAATDVYNGNFDLVILLSLNPHYAKTKSGGYFRDWRKYYKGDPVKTVEIKEYASHPEYISAVSEQIAITFHENKLGRRDKTPVIFAAEGIARAEIANGDPYVTSVEDLTAAVMANFGEITHSVGFYRSLTYNEKLTPSVLSRVKGVKGENVVIVPVSAPELDFYTNYKLNIELKETAKKSGIKNYFVIGGITESEMYMKCLSTLVRNAVTFAGL